MGFQVALHFVELHFNEEQQRLFDVKIHANGQMNQALTGFDIYHEAGDVLLCFQQRLCRRHHKGKLSTGEHMGVELIGLLL